MRSLALAVPLLLLGCDSGKPSADVDKPDAVYEVTEVDERPRLTNQLDLARAISDSYPKAQRDSGVAGGAMVRMQVSAAGSIQPGSVTIVEATHPAFGEAARSVARLARFEPAREGGTPVSVWVTLPIQFHPEDGDGVS